MAQATGGQIVASISSVLPPRRISVLARELGVVQRQRKVDVVRLVQALVLGFRLDRVRSLAGLRRSYQLITGQWLARSSFHARFTAPLAELMRRLTLEALARLTTSRGKVGRAFRPFATVLAVDSSLVRLQSGLAEHYPSVWSNHMPAAAKLTVVANVVGRGPKTLTVSPGSTHDIHLLKPGKWVARRLLIFDLGFYRARLFQSIDAYGGYFLSRVKKGSNPTVIRSHRKAHSHLVGKKLNEHQDRIGDDIIDIDAEVMYQIRGNKITHHHAHFRVVAIYDHHSGSWHRYITNAPPSMLPATAISAVYAARWELELLFRELKTVYRISDMPSGNLHATQALLYSAVLTLLASRRLQRLVRRTLGVATERLPCDRWARLFASISPQLLSLLARHRGHRQYGRDLLAFLCREAPDPNRSRKLLPQRAQDGQMAFA